jgi:hypothetical protein
MIERHSSRLARISNVNQIDPLPGKSQDVRRWRGSLNGIVAGLLVALAAFVGLVLSFGSIGATQARLQGQVLYAPESLKVIQFTEHAEDLSIEFAIHNISGVPVTVWGATTSCSCVVVDNIPFSIPAAGRYVLPLEISSGTTPRVETIELVTDPPGTPVLLMVALESALNGVVESSSSTD